LFYVPEGTPLKQNERIKALFVRMLILHQIL